MGNRALRRVQNRDIECRRSETGSANDRGFKIYRPGWEEEDMPSESTTRAGDQET